MKPPDVAEQTSRGLFESYQCPGGVYDEVYGLDRNPRGLWRKFVDQLEGLGGAELGERWNSGRRILRNHGVTYNVAAQEGTAERAWELDMAPFLLDEKEWAKIERGVIQRAHLHNLILQDIYTGPQHLLRDGLIPPALLFANPNFLRCCRGIRTPRNQYLHLHAVDLARAPDGKWWVLDDRMQSPNGVGYALENRTIVGRILHEVFRDLGVRRLNRFFGDFRKTLFELAPSPSSWPRVVILTPGIHSVAHYEHSLLARYLGFTLVEGADLSVRDNKVFLKTVEGPQQINVIVRRVNDTFCDPVELREDSFLGVPGLVQAARSGNVLVANALGSAVVETPALQASLPEIARHMLGEELLLSSSRTWWCGEAHERNHVLNDLENLIVKSAFPTHRRRTKSGAELSNVEREELRQLIQKRPHEFIGQAPVPLSNAPVWANDRFESRPIMLRVYIAARGDSFSVMPGGLTKVSKSSLSPVRGLQLAGGSKDTWIIGKPTSSEAAPLITLESRPAERLHFGVPSRAADIFFWLGRYTERLENLLQMLRAVVTRLLDADDQRTAQQAHGVGEILVKFGFCKRKRRKKRKSLDQEVLEMVYDPAATGCVYDLCGRIVSIATSVRDRFSGDAWRVLNRVREFPGKRPRSLPLGNVQSMIHDLMATLAALTGLEMENMTRSHEWRFLEIGRRLERSQNLCRLIEAMITSPEGPELHLNPVLEICDSPMTYRRRYYSEPDTVTVLDALLLDPSNPRSLRFNLNTMQELAGDLPSDDTYVGRADQANMIAEINQSLDGKTITRTMTALRKAGLAKAGEPYVLLYNQLKSVSDSLTQRYFNLVRSALHHHEFPLLSNPA